MYGVTSGAPWGAFHSTWGTLDAFLLRFVTKQKYSPLFYCPVFIFLGKTRSLFLIFCVRNGFRAADPDGRLSFFSRQWRVVLSDTFWMGVESSFLTFDDVMDVFIVTPLLGSLSVLVDVFLDRPGMFLCGGTVPTGRSQVRRSRSLMAVRLLVFLTISFCVRFSSLNANTRFFSSSENYLPTIESDI